MTSFDHTQAAREAIARRFVVGTGIEVGALHHPYPVAAQAQVKYVDRLTKAEALEHYPELGHDAASIVEPDIIDDGEKLTTIPDGTLDFVIASHFLEHCENPLATLRHHVRVLRPGGRLVLAVPNASDPGGWDRERGLTAFEHLVRDDQEGPETSRAEHYREWVTIADKLVGADAERELRRLMELGYRIHFHCWTPATFFSFLADAVRYNDLDTFLAYYETSPFEMVAILERRGGGAERAPMHDELAAARAERDALRLECVRMRRELERATEDLDVLQGTATMRLRDWALRSSIFGAPVRTLARWARGRLYQ